MNKSLFSYSHSLKVLFVFGYFGLSNGMPPEDDKLLKFLEGCFKQYEQDQQRRMQEASLILGMQKEIGKMEKLCFEGVLARDSEMQNDLKVDQDNVDLKLKKKEPQDSLFKEKENSKEVEQSKIHSLTEEEVIEKEKANAVVIVENINVPVESIELVDCMGNVKKGIARSNVRAIWEIPIKTENKPFVIAIVACARRILWKIKHFKPHSLELGLMQRKMSRGTGLMLQQLYESGPTPKYPQGFADWKVIRPFNVLKLT